MLTALCLIVCLPALTEAPAPGVVPPPAPATAVQQQRREREPEHVWTDLLGELRHATLLDHGMVGNQLLVHDSLDGITSVDPATGRPHWFVQLPGRLSHWPSHGDGVLAFACGTEVVVVAAETGRRIAVLSDPSLAVTSPVADRAALYVPSLLGDRVIATDLSSLLQAWEYRLQAPITTPALLVGAEARRSILVGCADGTLRALPAGTAVPAGEHWIARVGQVIDQLVVADHRIFVSSADRVLYALDEASGVTLWKHLPGELPASAPVIVGELVLFSTSTRVVALHAASGALAWEQTAQARPVGDLDGAVLCRTPANDSELRDAATGEVLPGRLPPQVVPVNGLLIEVRGGTQLVAWRVHR